MGKIKGGDLQIPNFETAAHYAWLRDKVPPRPGTFMKRIGKHPSQMSHRFRAGINRQRFAAPQIAKATAIVQPHDVISMGVGKKYCVEPPNVLPQDLQAKFRRSIHHDLYLV